MQDIIVKTDKINFYVLRNVFIKMAFGYLRTFENQM